MKIKLTAGQQNALDKFKNFIKTEEEVFILSGYAGTGKTLMINYFIEYIEEKRISYRLLASTGRAAKILSEKTRNRETNTVHRQIYKFEYIKVHENSELLKIAFKLNSEMIADEKIIYFVDESSMLSDKMNNTTYQIFGSGRLLQDFFKYSNRNKIVFIGDKCQLSPVNTKQSLALDSSLIYTRFKKKNSFADLKEIMRFKEESGIYKLTESLRKDIETKNFDYYNKWKVRRQDNIEVVDNEQDMVKKYVEIIKKQGIEAACMITHTNRLATELNNEIRTLYFKDKNKNKNVFNKNELLMVVQNNYLHLIFNGDQVQLISVSQEKEIRSSIVFRDAEVQLIDEQGGKRVNCKIIENLLQSPYAGLTQDQNYRLFVDFMVRKGNKLKANERAFKEAFKEDPYLNALRVKYGYATTCHKAQGGEWKYAFVNLEKSLYRPNYDEERYRWMYTAYSRAAEKLYLLDNYCFI